MYTHTHTLRERERERVTTNKANIWNDKCEEDSNICYYYYSFEIAFTKGSSLIWLYYYFSIVKSRERGVEGY